MRLKYLLGAALLIHQMALAVTLSDETLNCASGWGMALKAMKCPAMMWRRRRRPWRENARALVGFFLRL